MSAQPDLFSSAAVPRPPPNPAPVSSQKAPPQAAPSAEQFTGPVADLIARELAKPRPRAGYIRGLAAVEPDPAQRRALLDFARRLSSPEGR